jgi:hypothetical protein
MMIGNYLDLLDAARGSFSFLAEGRVKLTHDYRRPYGNLIFARDWRP